MIPKEMSNFIDIIKYLFVIWYFNVLSIFTPSLIHLGKKFYARHDNLIVNAMRESVIPCITASKALFTHCGLTPRGIDG